MKERMILEVCINGTAASNLNKSLFNWEGKTEGVCIVDFIMNVDT
jgi:hypothetical protein